MGWRVRTVLEQPPHQIRQQVAMPADGRVGATSVPLLAHGALEQPLAHPMQPLELDPAGPPRR